MGVITMKMISSTSTTSTSGVMLMSLFGPPLPPTFIDICVLPPARGRQAPPPSFSVTRPTRVKPASLRRRMTLRTSLYFSRLSALTTTWRSGLLVWYSSNWDMRFSSWIQFWPMWTLPSSLTETSSCFSLSGIFSGSDVSGRATSTPFWSMGVTTMKMISSTRQTSTRGVTLMSLRTSGAFIVCLRPSLSSISLLLFHEEVDQLGGRVRHLDLEPLELVGEVVEHPRGRNGHEQAE